MEEGNGNFMRTPHGKNAGGPPSPPSKHPRRRKPKAVRNLLVEFEKVSNDENQNVSARDNRKRRQIDKCFEETSSKKLKHNKVEAGSGDTLVPSTPLLEANVEVFVEGVSKTVIRTHNKLSKQMKQGLRFVSVFSEKVSVYVADMESGNDSKMVLQTGNYFRALAKRIPILDPAVLGWLRNGGSPSGLLDFGICAETGSRHSKKTDEKLFSRHEFVFDPYISFHNYKLSKVEMKSVVGAAGGKVMSKRISGLVSEGEVEPNLWKEKVLLSDMKQRYVIAPSLQGKGELFNELYKKTGIRTVSVNYIIDCLLEQRILFLENKYLLNSIV